MPLEPLPREPAHHHRAAVGRRSERAHGRACVEGPLRKIAPQFSIPPSITKGGAAGDSERDRGAAQAHPAPGGRPPLDALVAEVHRRRYQEGETRTGRIALLPAPSSRAAPTASAPTSTPRGVERVRELHQPGVTPHLELRHGGVHRDIGRAGCEADREQRHRERRRPTRRTRARRSRPRTPRAANGRMRVPAPVELPPGERASRAPIRPRRRGAPARARPSTRRRPLARQARAPPAAPEEAEREKGGERSAPSHTRSQPSGSCGIGHAGSGRHSLPARRERPLLEHACGFRAHRVRDRPARAAAACSSSSSSFHSEVPSGRAIRSSFSSKVSKPTGQRRSGCSKLTYQLLELPVLAQKT